MLLHMDSSPFEEKFMVKGVGIFDRLGEFAIEKTTASGERATLYNEVEGKLQEIDRVAKESLTNWVREPSSFFGKLKNKVRSLFHKIPTGKIESGEDLEGIKRVERHLKNGAISIGNTLHSFGDKIEEVKGKRSAGAPYDFSSVTLEEKEKLKEKASLIKTVVKVALTAGAVLLFGGVVLPFALGPLLISLPEIVALFVVTGCSLSSVAGVAAIVAASICKDAKPVVEHEAKTNEEFQQFVSKFVQNGEKDSFNLNNEDLQEVKLLEIYRRWKESTEEALAKL